MRKVNICKRIGWNLFILTYIFILKCRYHTLALVPSRSRVYGFGLGGSGQLGAKSTNNVNTPQVINGEWNQTQPTGVVAAKPDPPHCGANTSVDLWSFSKRFVVGIKVSCWFDPF